MDVDYTEVAKAMSTRFSGAILEMEQWKQLANSLFTKNEQLEAENTSLKDTIKDLEKSEGTPSND